MLDKSNLKLNYCTSKGNCDIARGKLRIFQLLNFSLSFLVAFNYSKKKVCEENH